MEETTIVVLALGLGVPLFLALVGTIIWLASRPRPIEGLGARPDGSGEWNAVLHTGALSRTTGRLRIASGTIAFTPDGAPAPAWQVPVAETAARRSAYLTLHGPGVDLWGPMGHLRLTVSRESVSRLSQSDFRTLREGRTAAEFTAALARAGSPNSL